MSSRAGAVPASFQTLFEDAKVVILDGGMGTTLQAPPYDLPLGSTLWSSELLGSEEGQHRLRDLHQHWVDSGAEILGSCTYQSSLPLFLPSQSTYTPQDVEEALSTMTAALPIITSPYVPSASTSFLPRFPTRSALSLGPFGAQLTPAQEYQGLYPPPFGPASTSAIAYSTAAASMVDLPLARVCTGDPTPEDYLAAWHLSRLEQFATSPTFDDLSMIAFETVPNMSETRAIRRAMALFEVGRRAAGKDDKPFYISYVFPMNEAGQPAIPDIVYRSLPLQQMAEVIIAATFGPSDDSTTPGGIGINCTNPLLLDPIISALAAALVSHVSAPAAPWLILYPDGGSVYDVVTRTWSNSDGMDETDWATSLVGCVKRASELKRGDGEGVYSGVIVGGCCKAGPDSISALRRICMEQELL